MAALEALICLHVIERSYQLHQKKRAIVCRLWEAKFCNKYLTNITFIFYEHHHISSIQQSVIRLGETQSPKRNPLNNRSNSWLYYVGIDAFLKTQANLLRKRRQYT